MEVRSSRRMRTLVTQMVRSRPVRENARALISMMARSTTGSNRRPDTLMQDRRPNSTKSSCNARPDHTGSKSRVSAQRQASALLPSTDMLLHRMN
jgi:hypothetical protein